MPPRLAVLRSIRIYRQPFMLPRRTLTTNSFPASYSLRIPMITAATILGVGVGLYSFSRVSNAETQSLRTIPGNLNREATTKSSRKQIERPGNTEKEGNQGDVSIQDNKSRIVVDSKKPEPGDNEDSKSGKVKGTHDDSRQLKHERLKNDSEEIHIEENQGQQEESDEEGGPQPIGNFALGEGD